MALEVLGFAEGFWVDWCVDIGADADDVETAGDWSGLGLVGRYHSELKVVHGVMVLGMWHEGLDSEYTVTSSSSYLSSLEIKGQKFGSTKVSWNWLQLVRCAYLQSCPGYFERRYGLSFRNALEQRMCTGTIPSTSTKMREAEVQSSYSSEVRGMRELELAYQKSWVEWDEIWVKFKFNIQNVETYMTRGT